jgi:hypothetical protein
MTTNDHTVPQMYLKRFADRRGRKYEIIARRVDDLGNPFKTTVKSVTAVNGFYWGTTPDGVPHHEAEKLLSQIEGDASPVFDEILDDSLYALPYRWPLGDEERIRLSWWIAAQLLRTTRQRKRLAYLAEREGLGASAGVRSVTDNNTHLEFMARQLAAVAFVLYQRPWGLGFSDACLLTSDVPVVILNGHDDENQLLSASFWDILLPLDPHRLLLMPGVSAQERDPRKRRDHRFKLDGGLGIFVNRVLFDAADMHVLHHPHHDPIRFLKEGDGPRLATPWTGEAASSPEYVLSYGVLHPEFTVERRWLTEHPPPARVAG